MSASENLGRLECKRCGRPFVDHAVPFDGSSSKPGLETADFGLGAVPGIYCPRREG